MDVPTSQTSSRGRGGAQVRTAAGTRRRPRQERARVTRGAVLEAAEQLLVEVGFAAASTNAIARRAGVSIGSLYQYFASKEAVYAAVLARHHEQVRPIEEEALQAMVDGRDDLRTIMARALDASLAVRDENPALMLALDEELAPLAARWTGAPGPDEDHGLDALTEALAGRLELPAIQARERAWLALTALEAVGRRLVHARSGDVDRRRLADLTVDMVAAMLAMPSPAGR